MNTQDAALALIEKMLEVQPAFDALNKAALALYGDFPPHFTPIADSVYPQVAALIDAVIANDELASYFIHECQIMPEGGQITEDGTVWRLKTVEDLRAYLNRDGAP